MSLYDLNKDMLIELLIERDNWDKLNNKELRERKQKIENILLKRKAEKLDSNIEHKEIIQKYRDYFLSASVEFVEENLDSYQQFHAVVRGIFLVFSKHMDIIVYIFEDNNVLFDPNIPDFDELNSMSNELEYYEKIISLLHFLEK